MLVDCTTNEQIRDTLKATLSSRIDGDWELLATAAGNCDALELSVKGITSSGAGVGIKWSRAGPYLGLGSSGRCRGVQSSGSRGAEPKLEMPT